jgi:hypothetical protein
MVLAEKNRWLQMSDLYFKAIQPPALASCGIDRSGAPTEAGPMSRHRSFWAEPVGAVLAAQGARSGAASCRPDRW